METDLSTALSFKLPTSLEEEFQNLKRVYLAKANVVYSQIAKKEKELSTLKSSGNEGKRIQTVNDFRNQIKDQEIIIDILKSEIFQLSDFSIYDLNKIIIKKLTEGPQIVRPKYREEIQNKIIELESSIKSLSAKDFQQAKPTTTKTIAIIKPKQVKFQTNLKFNIESFEKESHCLTSKIQSLDQLIQEQNDQIQKMVSENAQGHAVNSERNDLNERQCQEIEYSMSLLTQVLQTKKSKLKDIMSQNLRQETDNTLYLESRRNEFEDYLQRCDQLLQENTFLLTELDRTQEELIQLDQQQNQLTHQIEKSNWRYQQQLRNTTTKRKIEKDPAQIPLRK